VRNFIKSSGLAILVFALSGTTAQAGPNNGHCPRSKFATCGVTQAPVIMAQPASQTVIAGQPAAFSVSATGTGPISFQWKRNGVAINGANQSSYSTSTSTSDNGAQFSATVSNTAGAVDSNLAVLTVDPSVIAPSITSQPSSVSVTAGQSASFSIAASGTGPLAYQWNRNGAPISGANSSSYTVSATVIGDNSAQFSATVGNSAGSVTSSAAVLSVTAPVVAPSITSQPLPQTVTQGQTATFSVASTGTAPMTYQWNRNGSAIAGATSSTYTTPATTSSDNGSQFSVSVSNNAGSVTSGSAALTVQPPALAPGCSLSSGAWVNSSLPQAQMDSFRVAFDATPSVSPMDAVSGLSFGPATAYTDLATAVRFNSTGTIDAVNGTSFSAASAIPFTAGTAYHFILDVYISTHTYNAYVVINSTQIVIGSNLAFRSTQATAAALSNLGSLAAAGSDTICNMALSAAPATAPAITTQPLSQSVTAGQTATFSVTATGTATLNYQWSRNGAPISGATSASYITPATTLSDNNAQFSVAISNAAGSVTSNAASLTVSAPASTLLSVSATSLNFGSVNVSSSSTQNLTLTNSGTSSLTISQVLVAGAGFNSTNASGVILTPGQSTSLTVTFAPSATGAASGSLTISSNATNSPATISLSGSGITVSHAVSLTWSLESGAVGFNIYSSTVSGGPYLKINGGLLPSPTYTDSTVQSARTYYYVVTALDASNNESAYSTEVTAIIP
jgi:hypothetical protein